MGLLEPGDRLGPWLVQERHSGSWGVVYVVRNVDYQAWPDLVAAKTIRPELAGDTKWVDQFERECYTWLSLGRHPHLVRLMSVDRFRGQAYALAEYVPEKLLPNTLRGWLDANLVELEMALRFGVQICRALSYARGRGLEVHQDLKPENIMITPAGMVKVTDWGLSRMTVSSRGLPAFGDVPYKMATAQTLLSSPLGTRGYAAPELLRPEAVATHQSDLFSLAVMLVEMFSGRSGEPGMSGVDLAPLLRPMSPDVRTQLGDVLAACLAARPEDRPDSMGPLEDALSAAFEDLVGIPAEPSQPPDLEATVDLGTRSYGLFMLGRLDEAMQGFTELVNRMRRTEETAEPRPVVVVMDFKERGFKTVVPAELLRRNEEELSADPDNLDKLDSAISTNYLAGNLDRALHLCLRWLQRQPEDPQKLALAATLLSTLGRPKESLAYVDRAVSADPDNADLWLDRAKHCEVAGDLAEALSSVQRAVALQPDSAETVIRYGHLLSRIGNHRLALRQFEEVVRIDPQNATAWYNAGTTWLQFGSTDKAYEHLMKAVEVDPQFAQALNTLGGIAANAGTYQEAVAFYQRAIAANEHYARPHFNLGQIHEAVGQVERARSEYQQALAIDPDHALSRDALRRLTVS